MSPNPQYTGTLTLYAPVNTNNLSLINNALLPITQKIISENWAGAISYTTDPSTGQKAGELRTYSLNGTTIELYIENGPSITPANAYYSFDFISGGRKIFSARKCWVLDFWTDGTNIFTPYQPLKSVATLWATLLAGSADAQTIEGESVRYSTVNLADGINYFELPKVPFGITTVNDGNGASTLRANENDTTLNGNDGNDTLIGGYRNDVLNGGRGIDTADLSRDGFSSQYNMVINLGNGIANGSAKTITYVSNDILISIENAYGGTGNDSITGRSDTASELRGGGGNDLLQGGRFNDKLIGGPGIDTADYSIATTAVTVNLSSGTSSGALGSDTLSEIENVIGGSSADSLTGNSGKNVLDGKNGRDVLTGLGSADSFLFSTTPLFGASTADHITDFSSNEGDKLQINKAALGITGNPVASLTTVDPAKGLAVALRSSSNFVYDQSNGNLYWNQDGPTTGFGKGGIFAVLDNKASLSAINISLL